MLSVLIVDDEPDLRETIARILVEGGYFVRTAANGYEAVRILAEHYVNLLITDIRMPGLSGTELARQACLMHPGLHVIFMSGYNVGPIAGIMLKKPFRAAELLAEVRGL